MSAIKAVFVNHKRLPSRKAFQIILEVPEEQQKQVFDVLGYPNSDTSIWVGVARLQEQEDETAHL
jgi:hypothetical protein